MTDIKKIKHKKNTRHRRKGAAKPADSKTSDRRTMNRKSAESIDRSLIKKVILTTLQSELVDMPCVVNVLITDDKGIQEYNRVFRSIDRPTDVISFPMQIFNEAGWEGRGALEFDIDTGELPLGDIVISTEAVKRQAKEHESTGDRETVYLIIHSTLHLLGYDHDIKISKKNMRKKEKSILKEIG